MSALQDEVQAVALNVQFYRFTGFALNTVDARVGENVNAIIFEQFQQSSRDVPILAMQQAIVAINHRNTAAEAAHGLSELEPHKSPAQDKEVLWSEVEVQCFDVRQGLWCARARSTNDRCIRSSLDDE